MSYFRGGVEDMLLGSRGQVARLALGVKVEHEVLQGGVGMYTGFRPCELVWVSGLGFRIILRIP